jgi:adenylylsulfate kinase
MDPKSTNIYWVESQADNAIRQSVFEQRGLTLWFTGLSGSGKSTLAFSLERLFVLNGLMSYVLDGDNIRHGLNKDLGFSPEDRIENIRRIGEVAALFSDAGILTMTSFISPYKADRALARAAHERRKIPFVEVFVSTPLDVCEQRDPKGLYKKAKAGEIPNFTGISAPYESPENPEIIVHSDRQTPLEACAVILDYLSNHGYITNEKAAALKSKIS